MDGGRVEAFDGMTLVKWTAEDMICFLQEFGCNEHRYDPYQDGPVPKFRDEQAMWFWIMQKDLELIPKLAMNLDQLAPDNNGASKMN